MDIPVSALLRDVLLLRLNRRGVEANQRLLEGLSLPLSGNADEWFALGRELLSCCFWSEALALINALAQRQPAVSELLRLGLAVESGKYEDVELLAKGLAQSIPGLVPWAELFRVQAFIRQGKYAEADNLLNCYGGYWGVEAEVLRARLKLALGEHATSLALLERLIDKEPQRGELWAYLALAKPEAAEELWAEAFARQPRQPEALTNRARARYRRRLLNEALADAKAALALKPWLEPALSLAVTVLQELGWFDEAHSLAQELAERYPSASRAALALDALRRKGVRYEELSEAVTKTLTAYPDDPEVALAAAIAYQALGERDQALIYYRRRLLARPDDRVTRANLAKLAYDDGQIEEAVAQWRSLLGSGDGDIKRNLAFALLELGEAEEAISLIDELLKERPDDPLGRAGLASVHLARGNLEASWAEAQAALRLAPQALRSWTVAASIARRREGLSKAEELLTEAQVHVPDRLAARRELFQFWRDNDLLRARADIVRSWYEAEPDTLDYTLMWAQVLFTTHESDKALALLEEASKRDFRRVAPTLFRLLKRLDRWDEARALAEDLIALDPKRPAPYGMLAEALYKLGEPRAALDALNRGLAQKPDDISLLRQKVGVLLALEQDDAAVSLARTLAESGEERWLRFLLSTLKATHRFKEALDLCRSHQERGLFWRLELAAGLIKTGEREEAIALLKEELAARPTNLKVAEALIGALRADDRYAEALAVAKTLIADATERPDAAQLVAELLLDQGEIGAAIELLRKALESFPTTFVLYRLLLRALIRSKRFEEARSVIALALERLPIETISRWAIEEATALDCGELLVPALIRWQKEQPESLAARWAVYHWAKVFNPSLADQALEVIGRLAPEHPQLLYELSRRASDRWRMSEAIAHARRLCELRPGEVGYWRTLLGELVKAGDWSEFDDIWKRLERLWGRERYAEYSAFFFNINCHPDWDAERIFTLHRLWGERAVSPSLPAPRPHRNRPDPDRRLRIAYCSPDFRRHAVAYFSEPLLIGHDREQFELIALAHIEPNQADAYTERFKGYFDKWFETQHMSLNEQEQLVRELEVDMLVDLAGHTAHNALPLLARRPAPIQITYIFGAGQTTGLSQIDYFIADSYCVPEWFESYMTEKVIRLPIIGLPFKPGEDYPEPVEPPCLTDSRVVLGVLARPLRINRRCFKVWAEILLREPQAIIRFDHVPYAEPDIQRRIMREMTELGVEPERIEFANTRPHWKALQKIDLLLDPFPAGSGTVATEALWMERIVLSLESRPIMGRGGAAQLTAIGLSEYCVARSEKEYIDKALFLIRDRERLGKLSCGLRKRMLNSNLMDYEHYGRCVAETYRNLWLKWCRERSNR